MGGGPGIQAEKRTFKYLVDLYLIKELAHCMQLSINLISCIISSSMCHYSSVRVRTSERNALHQFRMTARPHQQILEFYFKCCLFFTGYVLFPLSYICTYIYMVLYLILLKKIMICLLLYLHL